MKTKTYHTGISDPKPSSALVNKDPHLIQAEQNFIPWDESH